MNSINIPSLKLLVLAGLLTCSPVSFSQAADGWMNYNEAHFKTQTMRKRGYELTAIECKHNPKAVLLTNGNLSGHAVLLKLKFAKVKGKVKTSLRVTMLDGNRDLSRFKKVFRSKNEANWGWHSFPIKYAVARENNKKNGRPILLCMIER